MEPEKFSETERQELEKYRKMFDAVCQWRDEEKERVAAIVNPKQRVLESQTLYILNTVLGEG